ncbi:MAG: hypothetical protein Q9182_001909 [Xanthomendoza sp. 2 TL-2023]
MASPEHSPSPQDRNSGEPSTESSTNHSRESSRPPKPKNRVRFTPGGESLDSNNQRAGFDVRDDSSPPARPDAKPLPFPRPTSLTQRSYSAGAASHSQGSDPVEDVTDSSGPMQSRPELMRESSSSNAETSRDDGGTGLAMSSEAVGKRVHSQQTAQERAERLSRMMGSSSAPGSRTASPYRLSPLRSPPPSPPPEHQTPPPLDFENIPLSKLNSRRTYGIEDEQEEPDGKEQQPSTPPKKHNTFRDAAARIIQYHSRQPSKKGDQEHPSYKVSAPPTPLRSGRATPIQEQRDRDYVPRPNEYREGFLSAILKLYDERGLGSAISHTPVGNVSASLRGGRRRESSTSSIHTQGTPDSSPPTSGTTTPKAKRDKWYANKKASSTGSLTNLSHLVHSATVLAHPGGSPATAPRGEDGQTSRTLRPQLKSRSVSALDTVLGRRKPDESIHIQVHIAETMTRQAYLMKMCKALMNYGAPTHRLEEQMRMSARVLEIEGQFLYIPGCMIISFDDSRTHTTEVKIVRTDQSIDLGKLREVHEIYKETLHDMIGVEEAMERLDGVLQRKQRYNRWLLVLVYGLASACVGPFAFGARPIDLPIAFLLGCCLGFMQLILAPKSELYSNIFESRNILAGSVRMVYAIIYSLFLGYGITIGTSFYGGIDAHATSAVSCSSSPPTWFPFVFVPPFTLCLIVINQGKWKQMPAMVIIAFTGYVVNHFSAARFASNAQIANTLGALAVGVMGNLYSRLRHGVAAAALLPAIFVQVPSGLAASGSLVSGVTSANQINNRMDGGGITTVSNGTQAAEATVNSMVFNVGYSMIQVAIGITVGLFLSALVVYPFGKRRSGLFSF